VVDDSLGRLLADEAGPLAPRWAARALLPAVASSGTRTEPQAQVLGLGPEDQSFPSLVAERGSADWLRLDGEHALVNARLARRIGLDVGDRLSLVVAVPEWLESKASQDAKVKHLALTTRLSLTVNGIVRDEGTADLGRAANVIVSRSALQR
jgi:hypothetical protein